jgi:hypothetical protein
MLPISGDLGKAKKTNAYRGSKGITTDQKKHKNRSLMNLIGTDGYTRTGMHFFLIHLQISVINLYQW